MMFPLELRIERLDDPESFALANNDGVLATPAPPRYHVTAVLLDVERRRTSSYEFWSMVVPSRGPYEGIGRITHTPTEAQLETLRRLRDALDEVLLPREEER